MDQQQDGDQRNYLRSIVWKRCTVGPSYLRIRSTNAEQQRSELISIIFKRGGVSMSIGFCSAEDSDTDEAC